MSCGSAEPLSAVDVSATVTDPGAADTVTCEISWGDGATEPGTLADGTRYTAIYEANRSQIIDPDMIYPGQVFVLRNVANLVPPFDPGGGRYPRAARPICRTWCGGHHRRRRRTPTPCRGRARAVPPVRGRWRA